MITPILTAKIRLVSTASRAAKLVGQEELAANLAQKSWDIFDVKMDKEFENATR